MHRIIVYCLFVLSMTTLATASALAQEGGARNRIGAGMVVDFGGEVDDDNPGSDDDLEATIGLRGHFDHDLHKYFSVGGFMRLTWWEGEDIYEERSFLMSLGPRLAGHYDYRDFRFYLAGMPGLLISVVDDDDRDIIDNPSAGFTMSIAPGMEYWFNADFALYVEFLGWIGHYFDHDLKNGGGDADFNLNQVAFNFGAVFGL